jgi:choline dehydrogenase
MAESFDYIIVGAGSAGCVLANRLSADPACRVLLLEAGASDRGFWIHLPVGYFRTIFDPRYARHFDTEPCEGSAGRNIVCPRGRVLGGSSSINGLMYIRGQREDFDDWAAAGAINWSFRDVLPAFKRYEDNPGGATEFRGANGEFRVSDLQNDHPYCAAWLEAAMQFGLPLNGDFNAATTYGVGRYQQAMRDGWRTSAATAFLRPVRRRRNLTIRLEASVSRVTFKGTFASGVEYLHAGKQCVAHADCEVILSAGAIQSPQLLQLSGIGSPDLLAQHGIAVKADVSEVGANLQDHYQMRTIVHLKAPQSLNTDVRNPIRLMAMGVQWLFGNRGPLTVGAGQVGGAACTKLATNGRPDVQFSVMPLSVDKPGEPLHRFPGFTVSVWQCHPRSRGRVSIRSNDPLAAPRIDTNYLAEEVDRRTLVAGMGVVRDIYHQPAFRGLWDTEVLPKPGVASEEELLQVARAHAGTAFHVSGTCRMGSDSRSVVDPWLRVRGVERLRVIDASVMPSVTSANTNATALMIGERGAELVRAGP